MDEDLFERINTLIDEEHQLLAKARPGHPLDDADEARLQHLEERLDQCWDLLRQRRARRRAGVDPDFVGVRDPEVVEGYEQ